MSRAQREDRALAASLSVRAEFEVKAANPSTFAGKPMRWFHVGKWRCRHGHVLTSTMKHEGVDGPYCLGCLSLTGLVVPVFLTFPEDREGPLPQHRYERAFA